MSHNYDIIFEIMTHMHSCKSRDFPLDHFFLDFFPPPEAALAFASFDFCGALAISADLTS